MTFNDCYEKFYQNKLFLIFTDKQTFSDKFTLFQKGYFCLNP